MTETLARAARWVGLTRLPSLGGGEEAPSGRGWRTPLVGVLAVAAAVLGSKLLLPQGLPNGIILLGVIVGGLNALPAIGIVLVYRANRIVNFSQGELGAFAASLAYLLIVTLHWPWVVAVISSLLAATIVGGAIEFGIMRRFAKAPRLLVTVATIGIAQLLGGLRLGLPGFFPKVPGFAGTFPSPFNHKAFTLSKAVYSWDSVIILVAVPLAAIGVFVFLRGTWAGLGTRAAAGNLDRSRLLGIPVRRMSTIVWALAGLLSGMTAVLKAPVTGFSLLTYSGTALMVRTLAPAAIGGFESLPITVAAALTLGVVEQAFYWNYAKGGPIETLLLVVLLGALLLRSRQVASFIGDDTGSWAAVHDIARVPRRLLRKPEIRTATLWGGFVLVQGLLVAPKFLSSGRVGLIALIGIHVIVGLSLIVLTGWTGQVSLGQWALVGVGAFVAGNAAARWHLDFFVILVIGTLAGGVLSLVLGLPAQRLPGIMYGVITLAFAAAAETWLFQLRWVTKGSRLERPMLFGHISMTSTSSFYYLTLAGTGLALLAVWNFKRFRLADVLLGVRDNPKAAEAFGISAAGARRLAFFLSGCLAGYAGVLYAFQQQIVDSNRFSAELGPSVLAMVVIGGLGSISGVVLGAVYVRTTQYLLPAWAGFFASGLGLLVVMLILPGGLGEVVFRLRDRLLARLAGESGQRIDRRDIPPDPYFIPEPGHSASERALAEVAP